jgi:thiol-disulfide isomerase/thioredoxin
MAYLKLFFLVIYMFYSPLVSGQKKTTIEVTGRLKGDYTGKIYLFFDDMYKQKDSISSEIINGNFQFTYDVSLPVLGRLHLGQTSLLADFYIDQKKVYLLCSNKMNVTNAGKDTINRLTIDSVTGSNLETTRQNIFRTLNISRDGQVYGKDTLEYFNKLTAFVEQNGKSKVAPYLITLSPHLSYSQLHSLYKKLDTSLNGTYEMKRVVGLLEWKERESLGLLNEGMPFHDVSLTDMNGKQINTKDIKGNYTLIICWATWCKPCMKENPLLKNVYNKYKDKGLTMIGISYDKSQSKWIDVVKQDSLSWMQLIDVNKFDGDLAKYYGFHSIGQHFLLDKNRKIITADSLEEILKRLEILMTLQKND